MRKILVALMLSVALLTAVVTAGVSIVTFPTDAYAEGGE